MENIKEVFGIIDGYELKPLGKLRMNKKDLFEDLIKIDDQIIEDCKKVLDNSGLIYTYERDKRIKAIYLFEEEKKEERILNNTKTVYTEEILEEQKEKFDTRLQEEFKDELLFLEYDKVYVHDNVMQIDPSRSKTEIYAALIGGAAIGFMFGWLVFEELTFGLLWAILFAATFSGLEIVVSKKRGRKKK